MSETIKILLKIKEDGIKSIENIQKKLENLQTSLSQTAIKDVRASFSAFDDEAREKVTGISSLIKRSIKETADFIQDKSEGTAAKVEREVTRTLESISTKTSLPIFGTIVAAKNLDAIESAMNAIAISTGRSEMAMKALSQVWQNNFAGFFSVISSASAGIDSFFAKTKSLNIPLVDAKDVLGRISESVNYIINLSGNDGLNILVRSVGEISFIKKSVYDVTDNVNTLINLSNSLMNILSEGLRIITKISLFSASFMVTKIFMRNALQFLQRITGLGGRLKFIDRVKRDVSTIDEALHNTSLTTGQIIKTATFGVAALVGPFSGIIGGLAFANSLTTSMLRRFTAWKLSAAAFFGNAKAQIGLIMLEVRNSAVKALPVVKEVSDRFDKISKTKGPLSLLGMGKKTELTGAIDKIALLPDKIKNISDEAKMIGQRSKQMVEDINQIGQRSQLMLEDVRQIGQKSQLVVEDVKFITNGAKMLTVQAKEISKAADLAGIRIKSRSFFSFLRAFAFGWIGRLKVRVGTFFGNTKAQTISFIRDARNLLVEIQPIIRNLGKEVEKVSKKRGLFSFIGIGKRSGITELFQKISSIPKVIQGIESQTKNIGETGRLISRDIIVITNKSQILIKSIEDVVSGRRLISTSQTVNQAFFQTFNSIKTLTTESARQLTVMDEKVKSIAANSKGLNPFLTGARSSVMEGLKKFLVPGKSENPFAGRVQSDLKGVFSTMLNFANGGQIKDLEKFGERLSRTFNKIAAATGNDKGLGKFLENLDKISKPSRSELLKSFAELEKTLGKKGGDAIEEFIKRLRLGLKDGKDIEKEVLAFVQLIAQFFPQSPPKKGPLKKTVKSGKVMVEMIAASMVASRGIAENAAFKIARRIADYFPQSPARLGPLVNLPRSGVQIVTQLSSGMLGAAAKVRFAAERIASFIFAPLDDAFRIGKLAKRSGLSVEITSLIDAELQKLGGTADRIVPTMQKLAKALNDPAEQEGLKKLGVDLQAVTQSSNPAFAAMLQLSDVLKENEIGTTKFNDALEEMGIIANSEIFDFLAQGSEKITQSLKDGAQFGAFYSEEFVKASEETKKLLTLLERARKFFFVDLLSELLPKVREALENLVAKAKENNSTIKAFLTKISSLLGLVFVLLKDIVVFIINNPSEALGILRDIAEKTLNALSAAVSVFLDKQAVKVSTKISAIGQIVYETSIDTAKFIIDELDHMLFGWLNDTIKFIEDKINKAKSLFTDVSNALMSREKAFGGGKTESPENSFFGMGFGVQTTAVIDPLAGNSREEIERRKAEQEEAARQKERNQKRIEFFEQTRKNILEIIELSNKVKEEAIVVPFASEEFQVKLDALKATLSSLPSELGLEETIKKIQEMINKPLEEIKSGIDEGKEKIIKATEEFNFFFESKAQAGADSIFNIFSDMYERITKKAEQDTRSQGEILASVASNAKTMFGDLYEVTGKKAKEFFFLQKSIALAEATMNVARGIMQAIGAKGILGTIEGAIISAAGAAQIAKISAQTFNTGGPVVGGSGVRDDVPALLTGGEFVLPVASVQKYGLETLEAMRRKILPKDAFSHLKKSLPSIIHTPTSGQFNTGGLVASGLPMQQEQRDERPINLTNVNVVDPTIVAKFFQQQEGKNMIFNVLSEDPGLVREIMNR